MRTIETDIYTYDELSEKAQQKAREWWLAADCGEDLRFAMECHEENDNVEFAEWSTYPHYVRISWRKTDPMELLFSWLQHGRECATYQIAKETLHQLHRARVAWKPDYFDPDSYDDICTYKRDWWQEECSECQAILDDFKHIAEGEYESMLRAEEEYLYSEGHISEWLIEGGYEFTEDGTVA